MCGNAPCEEDARTDGAVRPDDCVAADDRCAGINRYPVLEGRMPLLSAQRLSGGQRLRHQTDALVQLDLVSDDSRLSHHGTSAVIDEEVRTNAGTRMQIDSGARVRPFGHDAGNERYVLEIELVS